MKAQPASQDPVATKRKGESILLDCQLMYTGPRGSWRGEIVDVALGAGGLTATGIQLGLDPLPYRLEYELQTDADLITRQLNVWVRGQDWSRRLELLHDGAGDWVCDTTATGSPNLRGPGGEMGLLTAAVDCDLGRSPITNLMPIRRHNLHRAPGAFDFTMAWVSVPDLAVLPARQRYEHIGCTETGSMVRYTGSHRGFQGELELDRHGLVISYPGMAERHIGPVR